MLLFDRTTETCYHADKDSHESEWKIVLLLSKGPASSRLLSALSCPRQTSCNLPAKAVGLDLTARERHKDAPVAAKALLVPASLPIAA
eukprot:scaffold295611_cov32-Prasinocladus_malaysianus.AAC.1